MYAIICNKPQGRHKSIRGQEVKAFIDNLTENIWFISIISALFLTFMTLYFIKRDRYRKLVSSARGDMPPADAAAKLEVAWGEEYHVMTAQVELLSDMGAAGLVVYDFRKGSFEVNRNGRELLGGAADSMTMEGFEELIHPEDVGIYEEWFRCEDVRASAVADTPYTVRMRGTDGGEYRRFLFMIRPAYNLDGNILAIICAFVKEGE